MGNDVKHCPICKESFVLEKYLNLHLSSKHKLTEVTPKEHERSY